jgi:HK97 gp10 family phage protein
MSSVTVQVIGLQELERKLKALGPTIARKSLRSALVAGAKLIKKEAISLAPEKTGRLRKATYIKKMNKPNPFAENVIIGVRHGKKLSKRNLDAWYWTFQEFGTTERVQKKTGRRTGLVEGVHFITRAFEAMKEQALAKFKEVLTGNIKRVVQGGVR